MTTPARRIVAGDNLVWTNGNDWRILDAVGPDVIDFRAEFIDDVVASDAIPGWTATLVEVGAGQSTVTHPNTSAGAVLLTTDAAENDGINLQLDGEVFGFAAGQDLTYFGIRFQASEATQSDFLVGLCITDTTLLAGMTDGVYFECLDGGATISFVTEKDSTETQSDTLGTFVAATDILLEFCFDGTRVFAFIDGVLVATHTANIPDDELLTPSVHFLTGAASVETMTIDYVRAIQVGR